MKNASILFVIFLLIIGLSACGSNVEQSSDLESDSSSFVPVESSVQGELGTKEKVEVTEHFEELASESYVDEIQKEKATPEEIREILINIPYAGMNIPEHDWLEQPIVSDKIGIEIARFIAAVNGFWWPPSESFHSPEEVNAELIWLPSFYGTNMVQWDDMEEVYAPYHPELNALAPYVESHTYIKLHSHIEETAKNIFGCEIKIPTQQSSGRILTSYEFSGAYVYRLDAFGIPISIVPIILSYENIGDGYVVTCVFVYRSEESYFDSEDSFYRNEEIPDDNLMDYLCAVPGKHTITLKNNPNGGFYYWAHILPHD